MIRLRTEFEVFLRCSHSMRILMLSNMIYALLLPVLEIFVAAYVMRNSYAVDKVVLYQLSVYAGTPVAFLLNGILLNWMGAKHLYAAGMLLTGVAMVMIMVWSVLTPVSIAISGLTMGVAAGFFWANRIVLALSTTDDSNRNYYYGVELFVATLASVAIPALIGWFISGTVLYGWFGGVVNHAYRIIAVAFLGLTVVAAGLLERGSFRAPSPTRFLYVRFHSLWRRMIELALLKGLAQGYILTVPAMLILLLVGQEGTLGATQAVGGVLSACLMYAAGRFAGPCHRGFIFATGLVLFFVGALINALFFNALGVLIFIGCLLLAKPLLDLGYNPIELRVIDVVSSLEQRNEYAYFFNHDLGLFAGRALGCLLFLAIFYWGSGVAALKYALPIIALAQLFSIRVVGRIIRELDVVDQAA